MVELQSCFEKFHEKIRLDFDSSSLLREKRDMIVRNLKDGIKSQFPYNAPTFECLNQGSYALSTGVKPLDGDDYDIDVGIIFDFYQFEYQPVEVKTWVSSALERYASRDVEIKRPCVRVQYRRRGEPQFHVDLAVYSRGLLDSQLYIAKGLPYSSDDKKIWEISEPHELKRLMKSKFPDSSARDQFRRIIRYLKRWKDKTFKYTVNGKPTGIALTACCYQKFQNMYYDINALSHVISEIINLFDWYGISVNLPVEPYNNLFEKMSHNQMLSFKEELVELKEHLNSASSEMYTTHACNTLRKVFGEDFPEF